MNAHWKDCRCGYFTSCDICSPNDEIEIVVFGIPSRKDKENEVIENYFKMLLEKALSIRSSLTRLKSCESEMINCPTIF